MKSRGSINNRSRPRGNIATGRTQLRDTSVNKSSKESVESVGPKSSRILKKFKEFVFDNQHSLNPNSLVQESTPSKQRSDVKNQQGLNPFPANIKLERDRFTASQQQ